MGALGTSQTPQKDLGAIAVERFEPSPTYPERRQYGDTYRSGLRALGHRAQNTTATNAKQARSTHPRSDRALVPLRVVTRHAQTQTGVTQGGRMRFIIGAAVICIFFGCLAYLADRGA